MHSIEVVKHCLSFGGLWTRHLTSLITPGVGPAPPFYLHNSSANQLQLSSDLWKYHRIPGPTSDQDKSRSS